MRTLVLTALTMVAFSANSLLTRGALGHDLIDAASFTLIRLATGAVTLAALVLARGQASSDRGSWTSALTLAGYAVAFTIAYTRIGAGAGALLLFGAVQVTMIGTGLVRGERPLVRDWVGLALALAGLAWLTLPGVTAPDPLGAVLMVVAGACWGAYSLAGRGSRDPLAGTAGNFWRATIVGAIALVALIEPSRTTLAGAGLAAASGSLASGVGYTIWYTALPLLGAWRAAIVQLTVPILTGIGAAIFLGETIGVRLVIAAALVTSGVALTLRGLKR